MSVTQNNGIDRFLVPESISAKEAMQRMGKAGEKILFVVDEHARLIGSLTDGDIRRWVLSEGSLIENISKLYNRNPRFVQEDYCVEEVKKLMLKEKLEWIPVVDSSSTMRDVLLWDNVFGNHVRAPREKLEIPVIIMAGGKGTRLDPFTRVLPKPLIPIGDKTILELIMDKFNQHGVENFYLSINHRSQMIKAYFEETNPSYKIKFIEEEFPLGTAGSLRFIGDQVSDSLMVSNCDIIIDGNYHEMQEFHKSNNNDITIIGSFRHFTVPYGICYIENGGTLVDIKEKPEFDFLVNTGMYLLKKDVLKLIPQDKFFNMTDLIKKVKESGGKVGVFPVDEKSWIDVGQWEEYKKAVKNLGLDN